jgi:hypothetical protein
MINWVHDRRRVLCRAVVALTITALAGACGWGNSGSGGGGEQPTTAEARVGITVPTPSATAPCNATVQWSLHPLRLTGTSGRDSALGWTGSYTAQPAQDHDYGDRGYSCSFGDIAAERLRAGTWRFQAAAGPYGGSCDVTLQNGGNVFSVKAGLVQARCTG